MLRALILFLFAAFALTSPAMAYVGPGSSLGAVGVFLGLIGTFFLTLVSFVWYPIKRLIRTSRRRLSRADKAAK